MFKKWIPTDSSDDLFGMPYGIVTHPAALDYRRTILQEMVKKSNSICTYIDCIFKQCYSSTLLSVSSCPFLFTESVFLTEKEVSQKYIIQKGFSSFFENGKGYKMRRADVRWVFYCVYHSLSMIFLPWLRIIMCMTVKNVKFGRMMKKRWPLQFFADSCLSLSAVFICGRDKEGSFRPGFEWKIFIKQGYLKYWSQCSEKSMSDLKLLHFMKYSLTHKALTFVQKLLLWPERIKLTAIIFNVKILFFFERTR